MTLAIPTDLLPRLQRARDEVARLAPVAPRLGIVLGSGLGALAETLDEAVVVPYRRLPEWPVSTVHGHAGRLVLGRCEGVPVAVMQGRVHLYEGYAPWQVVFGVRVLALLGCRALLLTNAAGAVNETYAPGDLMLIRDHLNLQGSNPCTGPNVDVLGSRFFDMSATYAPEFAEVARMAALERDLSLREGVYAGLLGPSYETPAEIRMLRALGADAVGMSTVPEAIAGAHAGMKVLGMSCITNMAAGVLDQPIDHEEVMVVADRVRDELVRLLRAITRGIGEHEGWGAGP